MAKTKKKEVKKQGLRPSQKAKAEKLRQKQEDKVASALPSLQENIVDKTEQDVVIDQASDKSQTIEPVATITVKNADGDPDTEAQILIQNKIDYTPKVSVVMPVYNVEPYLRQCLDSVTSQTLKEIEIICVDDGSTDASLDILKEYATKDNRITVITQKNLYAGVARNVGLSQAKGEYLCFLDSDDFFELNMLEEMLEKAETNASDIVVCSWYVYDQINGTEKVSQDGVPIWVSEILEINPDYDFAANNDDKRFFITNPAPWNKLFKKSLVNEIRFQNLTCCNDIGFVYSALGMAKKINVLNKNFLHYRKSNGNTSHKKHQADNIIKAANYIKSNLIKYNLMDKLGKAFYRSMARNFYYEYCRCTDIYEQTQRYKKFLPAPYFDEFKATFDGNRKRKIVFVGTDNVCRTTGGAITVFWERANLFQDAGFNVVCLYEDDDNNGVIHFNHNIKTQNIKRIGNIEAPTNERFQLFLSKEKPDIVIFLMPSVVYKYTKNVEMNNLISILMVHSRPDVYFEGNPNKSNLIESCSKINYMQALLPSYIPILKAYFPKATVAVIPNYVIPVNSDKSEKEYKKFVFFSRCDVGKNIPLLINAFKIVHDLYPEWSLDIYGESEPPTYIDKVKNLVNIAGLNQSVHFYPKSQKGKDVLLEADAFVFPSYFEGFSLGLMEGLSAELPAIGLEGCSGTNEVIIDGKYGFLVKDNPQDFASKMIYLIEHPNERKAMGKDAKNSVAAYSRDNINEKWIKFIVDIMNKTFREMKINVLKTPNIYPISYIRSNWDDYNPKYDSPLVSIIVPVFNVVEYIDECLQSLLKQTFREIEIICVDDNSTDGSYEKIQSYQKTDDRIKIYRNSSNRKSGFCRNFALQKARGEYIMFCDGDDFIKPETVTNLYQRIKKFDADICQFLLCIYNNRNKEIIELPHQNFDSIKKINKDVYTFNDDPGIIFRQVEPVLKMYKREFLLNNNILFYEDCFFEDTIVHIKSMSLAKRICFDDNIYYYYRKNREGQTTSSSVDTSKFLDIFNYINESEPFLKKIRIWKKVFPEYYSFCIERFISYYRRCNQETQKIFSLKVQNWLKKHKLSSIINSQQKKEIEEIIKNYKENYGLKYWLCSYLFLFINLYKVRKLKRKLEIQNILKNRQYGSLEEEEKLKDEIKLLKILNQKILDRYRYNENLYMFDFSPSNFEYLRALNAIRIDAKLMGDEKSNIEITSEEAMNIKTPKWYQDEKGTGKTLEGFQPINSLKITPNQDGTLVINFLGQSQNTDEGRIPLWIDYTSIQIDGKENLVSDIAVWHDTPYQISIVVKKDQIVKIDYKTKLHKYNYDELLKLLLILNPCRQQENEIILSAEKIYNIIHNISICSHVNLTELPSIVANKFIPIGEDCKSAQWLKDFNLRGEALPFDWLEKYSLSFVLRTLRYGIKNWFISYSEDKKRSGTIHRYVVDKKNHFAARHIFPLNTTIEEYRSIFISTFQKRYTRLLNILENCSNVCFVSNRNESLSLLCSFLIKIHILYPQKNLILFNIRHHKTKNEIRCIKFDDQVVLYDVTANDLAEDVNSPLAWMGNKELRLNLFNKLSLSQNDEEEDKSAEYLKALNAIRIDAKLMGNEKSNIEVISTEPMSIKTPKWYQDDKGIGKTLEGFQHINSLKIIPNQDGTLVINFLGQSKNTDEGRVPFWVDYTSIQVDGKENLASNISAWHNRPYQINLIVKKDQIVKIDYKTKLHKYNYDELLKILLILNPNYIDDLTEKNFQNFFDKYTLKCKE